MTSASANAASRAGEGVSGVRSAGAAQTATDGAMSAMARQVVQQVAPQVAGRLLDVVAQRASTSVDNLTSRLETLANEGGTGGTGGLKAALTGKAPAPQKAGDSDEDGESEKLSVPSRVRAGLGFVIEQAIQLLELVKQWVTRLIAAAQQWLGRSSTDDTGSDDPANEETDDNMVEDEEPDDEEAGDRPATTESGSRNRS